MTITFFLLSIIVIILGTLTIFGSINPNPPGIPSGVPQNYLPAYGDIIESSKIMDLYQKHQTSGYVRFADVRREIDSAVVELNFIISVMESNDASISPYDRNMLAEAIKKVDSLLRAEPNRYTREVHQKRDKIQKRLSGFGIYY